MASGQVTIPSAGRPLSAGAVALMLIVCLSWGFNQIAVKLTLADIPPMLQATIRSAGALPVLLLIARLRGVKMLKRDGTLRAGLLAGVIFGVEFVLIYRGLQLTSASRAVVFLYTAPFFVALGSYQFLGERLRASQWGGLGLSFAGVALAIGVPQADVGASVLLGDLMIVCGGLIGLFMGSQISGFGDIQQRINGNRDYGAGPIYQVKPGNYQQRGGPESQGQGVVHNEIASHDAKQRGDEGKSRQFAGGIGLHQRKPQQKRQSDHPDRLIDHQ